ncbi:TolC family protein [Halomonas qinghailakensis]|uniref:TolC family protein n=1 Tax=Halomonas qinghailakensis TaxID=2937790 RepID=A0AA46TRN8_9GAMM|nr:TolC family protein [Halomonas sp. ZZQ-149]UYO74998.1 TolC family protein [Halomonas sp. ZZQ-149]
MKSSSMFLWASLLMVAIALPSQHVHAQPLALEDAWQQLRSQDDDVAAGQAAQQRAVALLSTRNNLLLPQIDLIGSYTHLDNPIEVDALALNPLSSVADSLPGQRLVDLIGGPNAFRTPVTNRNVARSSLAMFWPLYTGGKISSARELLTLEERAASLLLEDVYRARFMDLVTAYYGLVMAERALTTQQQAENTLAHHYHSAQALEDQYQIARVERLAAEAAYDRSRITTRAIREQRDSAQQALASLVHYTPSNAPGSGGHSSGPTPTSPLFTLASLPPIGHFQPGLADHPVLRLLANKQAQAESVVDASRGLYHPNVFMFGSYNLYEDDSLASDLTPDWLVGVGVSMPLVDRSGRSGKVQAAVSTVSELRYRQLAASRKLELLLDQQYRDANQALEEYSDLASTVALAEESLRLQTLAFSEGIGRALDVIDAQTFLSTTHTRRDAAAFRFVMSFAQLLSITGQQESLFAYLSEGDPIP